jgi:hypothetical protein
MNELTVTGLEPQIHQAYSWINVNSFHLVGVQFLLNSVPNCASPLLLPSLTEL